MSGLTIGWEYLTGYAVATDPSSRDRAEWPPHPARVFMALAAAWFETGQDSAEGKALRWLECLGHPQLYLPCDMHLFERANVTVYVPVNDRAAPPPKPKEKKGPTMRVTVEEMRSRQPRTFPRTHVGDALCFLHWPQAAGLDAHREALDRVCGRVTRIGHSSSLVRMWVADAGELQATEIWLPERFPADVHCRVVSPGLLDQLSDHTQISQIECVAEFKLRAEKATAPPRLRPRVGFWVSYRRSGEEAPPSSTAHTHFDSDMLVLKQVVGPTLPLVTTVVVTAALRATVMKRSALQPVPTWISGHRPTGERSEAEAGHLAFIPLPFVGQDHADGHLLGMALVFPRSVHRPERGQALGRMLLQRDGQPALIELTLGRLGVWCLQKCDWSERRMALQPESWTASPQGALTWASVTPVVLDRFPKTDRSNDRVGWETEVAVILREACRRIDLPPPVRIEIGTTPWQRGSARAVGKRRPLRGPDYHLDGTGALGDGFPFFPAKGTKAPRPQVHVRLQFDQPLIGPVLLGAGRYLGYGLFKPCQAEEGR